VGTRREQLTGVLDERQSELLTGLAA